MVHNALLSTLSLLIPACFALLPPPDISNISLTVDPNVCDDHSPFLALFLVLSHPGSIDERQLIRDAYPAQQLSSELAVRRVFVLATLRDGREPNAAFKSIAAADVREEADVYGDVIQLNATEEYRKLTLKSLAAFTWAAQRCAHARFVVKCDSNVVMDYYAAARHLRAIADDDVDAIRGFVYKRAPVVRDRSNWKYYTSDYEFPGEFYPDYAATVYATSLKTIRLLVETAKEVPFLNCEDVFFTGLCAERANVTRRDWNEIIGSHRQRTLNCCISDRGKVFACQYFLLKDHQFYRTSRMMVQRYKNHGRHCHFRHCETYSKEAEANNNLTCY